MSSDLKHHRFTLGAYEKMIAHGILTSGDRVELIRGEIVQVSPIGSRHAACVKRLNALLVSALGGRAIVGVQDPIALPPDSEPEPDITLLRPRVDFYASAHPRPSDVLLLIEVAESSLEIDRGIKLPLYAAAGIAEVWLVDVATQTVEVYTGPQDDRYTEIRSVHCGDRLEPRAFTGISFTSDAIFSQQ